MSLSYVLYFNRFQTQKGKIIIRYHPPFSIHSLSKTVDKLERTCSSAETIRTDVLQILKRKIALVGKQYGGDSFSNQRFSQEKQRTRDEKGC